MAPTKDHPLIMISLDAVANEDVDYLLTLPNFQKLASYGKLHRQVDSVFVTNTYSVHASIATGELPNVHGIFDNVIDQPNQKVELWRAHKRFVKAKTLLTRAEERGMVSCAMMFPCTPGEKVKYHIPEVPGSEAALVRAGRFLRYSSFGYLFRSFLVHGRRLRPFNYYGMDAFIAYTSRPLISKKKADLYMLHLLDVDAQKHRTGIHSEKVRATLEHTDQLLGIFLDGIKKAEVAAGNDPEKAIASLNVLLFSDHSCKDVEHKTDIHSLLLKHHVTRDIAFFHSTSGACFLHVEPGISKEDRQNLDAALSELRSMPAVARELTEEEMEVSGANMTGYECGFAATPGYGFGLTYKGQHGYPLDTPEYKIFYLEIGPDLVSSGEEGSVVNGGSILEVGKKAISLVESHPGRKKG